MKNILYLPALLFVIYSCGNNKTETEVITTTEISLWDADMDSGLLKMEKRIVPDIDTINVENVISYLNTANPKIKLSFLKSAGDTIFLEIEDASFLTQQMGSTGPEMYLAEVIYNCTELPGIHFVNLDFEEGDHAQPGTYKREDFIK